MSNNKKVDSGKFSEFMSRLADSASTPANEAVLKTVREKLEKQKADEVEAKLMRVYQDIQAQVSGLRILRKQEKAIKEAIVKLEEKAERIISGTEEENY